MPRPLNIEDHLRILADEAPNQIALISPQGTMSYAELEQASSDCASGLERSGISRGTRTVLMVTPGPEMLILAFGLIKLRAIPILIDPGMGLRNLKKCLEECGPEAFIGIPKAHLARILLGWGRGSVRRKVMVGGFPFPGTISWSTVMEKGRRFPVDREQGSPDDLAAIVFTSGSTGIPKGVVYTHRMFSAQARLLKESFNIAEGEVDLATFPLFALYDPALRMTTVFPRMDFTQPGKVDPMEIIGPIQEHRVTHMFGSPALLNRVGRFGKERGIKMPTIKRVLSAGAPVSDQVLDAFGEMLSPEALIHTPYGATEALPVSSISHLEREEIGGVAEGKGVCVGRALPGVDLRIVGLSDEPIPTWNDELGTETGAVGEITVRGDNVSPEYFKRDEATRLAKIPVPGGGFYHRMGDLGYRDDQGRIWFCGRKSHRVQIPGGTLFTVPCEGIFNAHPAVFRTALVGVVRAGKELPVLCVELESGFEGDRENVRAELLETGSRYEMTSQIKTILFHSGFPVDIRHNAKIFREKLAVWAQEELK